MVWLTAVAEACVGAMGLWRSVGAKTHHLTILLRTTVAPERRRRVIAGQLMRSALGWSPQPPDL